MVDIPSRDWNPFLWAGGKLRGTQKDGDKEAGLRTRQSESTAQTAERASGIINVHLQTTLGATSKKGPGHKAWLGPVVPPKPKSLEGIPSVRINPETKKLEAHPGYQEAKSKIQHFEEAMDAARGNPHRVEFSGGI